MDFREIGKKAGEAFWQGLASMASLQSYGAGLHYLPQPANPEPPRELSFEEGAQQLLQQGEAELQAELRAQRRHARFQRALGVVANWFFEKPDNGQAPSAPSQER